MEKIIIDTLNGLKNDGWPVDYATETLMLAMAKQIDAMTKPSAPPAA